MYSLCNSGSLVFVQLLRCLIPPICPTLSIVFLCLTKCFFSSCLLLFPKLFSVLIIYFNACYFPVDFLRHMHHLFLPTPLSFQSFPDVSSVVQLFHFLLFLIPLPFSFLYSTMSKQFVLPLPLSRSYQFTIPVALNN